MRALPTYTGRPPTVVRRARGLAPHVPLATAPGAAVLPAVVASLGGSCPSPLRIIPSAQKPGTRPPYQPLVGGMAMIPPHFDSQVVVLGLLWLCGLLHSAWSSAGPAPPTKPSMPRTLRRRCSHEAPVCRPDAQAPWHLGRAGSRASSHAASRATCTAAPGSTLMPCTEWRGATIVRQGKMGIGASDGQGCKRSTKPAARGDDRRLAPLQTVWARSRNMSRRGQVCDPVAVFSSRLIGPP